jgi:signal recognition particle subunit SRP54
MMPKGAEVDEGEVKHTEAIIYSMTPHERRNPKMINGSRRRRIADGSGMMVQDVNALLKDFEKMKKMMKGLVKGGPGGKGKMPRGLPKFPM